MSEIPSSIPQEVDEDSDLEAAPAGTDGYRILALDEVSSRRHYQRPISIWL